MHQSPPWRYTSISKMAGIDTKLRLLILSRLTATMQAGGRFPVVVESFLKAQSPPAETKTTAPYLRIQSFRDGALLGEKLRLFLCENEPNVGVFPFNDYLESGSEPIIEGPHVHPIEMLTSFTPRDEFRNDWWAAPSRSYGALFAGLSGAWCLYRENIRDATSANSLFADDSIFAPFLRQWPDWMKSAAKIKSGQR